MQTPVIRLVEGAIEEDDFSRPSMSKSVGSHCIVRLYIPVSTHEQEQTAMLEKITKECNRLAKRQRKLRQALTRWVGQINSVGYISNAPKDVKDRDAEVVNNLEDELDTITKTIRTLASIGRNFERK
jgi:valyl-tRNA synthetase